MLLHCTRLPLQTISPSLVDFVCKMSSQRMVGKTECQALDEVGFRERYSDAFDLDETLTPGILTFSTSDAREPITNKDS